MTKRLAPERLAEIRHSFVNIRKTANLMNKGITKALWLTLADMSEDLLVEIDALTAENDAFKRDLDKSGRRHAVEQRLGGHR